MNEKYILFISLCLLIPTLENLGLGIQKWAIDRSPKTKSRAAKWGWGVVWTIGTLMTIAVAFIAFKTLSLGNASTFGAFAGFGLIPLTIFSFLVLKEKIVPKEILGIAIIMLGTSTVGYFSHGAQKEILHPNYTHMIYFFIGYLIFVAIGAFIISKTMQTIAGVIMGIIAGTVAGTGISIQKIVSPMFMAFTKGEATFHQLASNPLTWVMVCCGITGVVILQFSFKYGKAVQIVPSRAASYIMMPVIAGLTFLGEPFPPLCFLGIALVIIGVIITTTADPKKHGH
jgi:drug/metabolite transporter (DMT)-like permease